jgi:hypothetical protein
MILLDEVEAFTNVHNREIPQVVLAPPHHIVGDHCSGLGVQQELRNR